MLESFAGRAYLVCCDARTGSNLLADSLRGVGRAGKPFEYFNRGEIDKRWLRAELRIPERLPFAGWRDYILRAGSEMGGVFAASVHYWQLETCLETFRAPRADPAAPPLAVLRGFFPELRLVWLRRRNVVAQAISHYVAIATDVWDSRPGGAPPGESDRGAAYDFAKIDHQVTSALVAARGWREALAGGESITLPLASRSLPPTCPQRSGASWPMPASIPATGLRKQAGPWSREMERLYREERHARGLGAVGDEG